MLRNTLFWNLRAHYGVMRLWLDTSPLAGCALASSWRGSTVLPTDEDVREPDAALVAFEQSDRRAWKVVAEAQSASHNVGRAMKARLQHQHRRITRGEVEVSRTRVTWAHLLSELLTALES